MWSIEAELWFMFDAWKRGFVWSHDVYTILSYLHSLTNFFFFFFFFSHYTQLFRMTKVELWQTLIVFFFVFVFSITLNCSEWLRLDYCDLCFSMGVAMGYYCCLRFFPSPPPSFVWPHLGTNGVFLFYKGWLCFHLSLKSKCSGTFYTLLNPWSPGVEREI